MTFSLMMRINFSSIFILGENHIIKLVFQLKFKLFLFLLCFEIEFHLAQTHYTHKDEFEFLIILSAPALCKACGRYNQNSSYSFSIGI